ncbi:MAG: peptidase, partial [Deferribacteres bacterium]|nr:peptidase [Deferribacteres bacterium]
MFENTSMKDQLNSTVDNIFKINLAVRAGERVLVITDEFNEEITETGRLIAERGRRFTPLVSYIRYSPAGCHGAEPPAHVWAEAFGENAYTGLKESGLLDPIMSKTITGEKIKDAGHIVGRYKEEAADVVIAISYFSTSHTRFRDLLTGICGTRYASMPLFDERMLAGPMRVDWNEMMEMTHRTAEIVNKYEKLQMKTPNGTSITLRRGGRKARCDTGILTAPGSFGNLPAGEVYFAPLEGSAEGRLVLEWAPTRRLEEPVTLHVGKGLVEEVEGSEPYAEYLRE